MLIALPGEAWPQPARALTAKSAEQQRCARREAVVHGFGIMATWPRQQGISGWLGGGGRCSSPSSSVVVFDLLVSVSHAWPLAKIGYQDASVPPRLVRDADVDSFSSYGPTAPLVLAARVIPRNATYSIVVGQDPPTADPGADEDDPAALAASTDLRRRSLREAQWVIAYHESSEKLGIRYSDETGLGAPGTNVVRVEH